MSLFATRNSISTCLLACLAAASLLHAGTTDGKRANCGTDAISIDAPTDDEVADSCHGAADAIKFLNSQGLSIPETISVGVVPKMPAPVHESVIGAYMRAERKVLVLTYDAFKERSVLFKPPLDRSLYRAIVSHEVAHAIAHHNFKKEPSSLGQEYVAYVTLFSTMASSQREKILQQYPYDSDWQVHAFSLYFIDPLGFGAQAYQHFLKPENGKYFMRKVLDGEVLAEPE